MLLIGLAVHITGISEPLVSPTLPECISAGSRTGLTEVVPLPYDVNQIAHKPILDELHDFEKLPSLTNTRSSVYSSVRATNRELTERLACALKRYSRADSNDKEARSALLNEIILVLKQTNYMALNASRLYDLYSSFKPAYDEYKLTVAKALEAVQLDDRKAFWVSAQPLINKWLGFDYKEMYWDPWIEKGENSKKVQSAMIALEKELGRLEKIEQVTQEVGYNLRNLAFTLFGKDTRIIPDGGSLLRGGYASMEKGWEQQLEGGESWEKGPKVWFREHVARYVVQDEGPLTESQFDTWWIDLDCWCNA
jgi:hypothetical protein